MPYRIEKRNGQHCVVKSGEDQPLGCHDTRPAAVAQMRAVLANESAEDPHEMLLLSLAKEDPAP